MAENSNIEWCDHTFNPWVGCTKVSPACDHCFAEGWAKRSGSVQWGGERRRTTPANWRKPLQWQAQAATFQAEHGRRQRVFCASLADVFDNQVPWQWRLDLFDLISRTPNLNWLLLTKRIGNVSKMLDEIQVHGTLGEVFPNVWLGATICNQAEADRDIPKLLEVDARVRFLSIEPMLGPVNLTDVDDGTAHRDVPREEWGPVDDEDSPPGLWWNVLTGKRTIMHGGSSGDWSRRDASVDWVICGGESGPGARPMHPDWARSLRDQCALAGVPFLFKQWGEWCSDEQHPDATGDSLYTDDLSALRHTTLALDPTGATSSNADLLLNRGSGSVRVHRVGKKSAGRLLDGIEHNGFPEVRHAR